MKKNHSNKAAAAPVKDLPVNPTQLVTYDQARSLADVINALSLSIGGGVKPELTDDNANSGIYHPLWGGSDFPEPNYTDDLGNKYYPLEFRFVCGAGNNVGMIYDLAKKHPAYVDETGKLPPAPLNWPDAFTVLRASVDAYIQANPQS